MKRSLFSLALFFMLFATSLYAQNEEEDSILHLQESILSFEDETFNEYCYFHNFIWTNVHGLSFVVTTVYNSDLTKRVPLVVLSGINPTDENLIIRQIFTVEQAEEVIRYLEFLYEVSEVHPKGIHRVFNGPAQFKIITYDSGSRIKVAFLFHNSLATVSVSSRRGLSDWINAFHKCLDYIEGLSESEL